MLDNTCLQSYVAYFACKINTLADKYETSLDLGSDCADTYLFQLEVAIALNEILCSIDIEEESCLTNDQVCDIVEKLKYILNKSCNC